MPTEGWSPRNLVQLADGLLGAALAAVFAFAFASGAGPADSVLLGRTVAVLALAAGLGLLAHALHHGSRRETLRVDSDQVELLVASRVYRRRRRLRIDEIEAVEVAPAPLFGTAARHGPAQVVRLVSDRRSFEVGHLLDDRERRWLRDTLLHLVSKPA